MTSGGLNISVSYIICLTYIWAISIVHNLLHILLQHRSGFFVCGADKKRGTDIMSRYEQQLAALEISGFSTFVGFEGFDTTETFGDGEATDGLTRRFEMAVLLENGESARTLVRRVENVFWTLTKAAGSGALNINPAALEALTRISEDLRDAAAEGSEFVYISCHDLKALSACGTDDAKTAVLLCDPILVSILEV
jgi:hypothetical protein